MLALEVSLQASSNPEEEAEGIGSQGYVGRQPSARLRGLGSLPSKRQAPSRAREWEEMGAEQQKRSCMSTPHLLPNPPAMSQVCCMAQST